jgi:transcriptional regulator with XRE-family HTH domain
MGAQGPMNTWAMGNLKLLRTKKGWTQQDLATNAKVNVGTVSRLERGSGPLPKAGTVVKLATALGVEPEALWTDPAAASGDQAAVSRE